MMSDLFLYQCYKKGLGASFITLTYSPQTVPYTDKLKLTLRKSDFQRFQKRFRYYLQERNFPLEDYKYIACGEYGDTFGRPHYHFIALGITQSIAEQIVPLAWNHINGGITDVGALAQGGLNYVLKYCTKSMLGKEAKKLYDDNGVERPFLCHSRNLETDWILRNLQDIEEHNFSINFKGRYITLPNYYRKKYDKFKQFDSISLIKNMSLNAKAFGFSLDEYSKIKSYNLERELLNQARNSGSPADFSSLDKIKTAKTDINRLALEAGDPVPF